MHVDREKRFASSKRSIYKSAPKLDLQRSSSVSLALLPLLQPPPVLTYREFIVVPPLHKEQLSAIAAVLQAVAATSQAVKRRYESAVPVSHPTHALSLRVSRSWDSGTSACRGQLIVAVFVVGLCLFPTVRPCETNESKWSFKWYSLGCSTHVRAVNPITGPRHEVPDLKSETFSGSLVFAV